jgi:hypothetical protein
MLLKNTLGYNPLGVYLPRRKVLADVGGDEERNGES